MMKDKAESRIEAIDDRLDELHQQFDYGAACEPSVDSSEEEMELFWEVERLHIERSRLEDFVEGVS